MTDSIFQYSLLTSKCHAKDLNKKMVNLKLSLTDSLDDAILSKIQD